MENGHPMNQLKKNPEPHGTNTNSKSAFPRILHVCFKLKFSFPVSWTLLFVIDSHLFWRASVHRFRYTDAFQRSSGWNVDRDTGTWSVTQLHVLAWCVPACAHSLRKPLPRHNVCLLQKATNSFRLASSPREGRKCF